MKTSRIQKGSLIAAAALVLGITAISSTVHAYAFGGVTITGTRYVDGAPTKVRCTAAAGNGITFSGGTTLTIIYDSSCGIYSDTDDNDQLLFQGPSNWIIKNGVATMASMFSGVQTAGGPSGTDPAHGTMTGVSKYVSNIIISEKGTISYSRKNSANQDVIFVGKFKTAVLTQF
jgi:hypothetical protein